MISENCCNCIVRKYKVLQTIIAMLTEDKVTELLFIADEFCKFFDWMIVRYTPKNTGNLLYQRQKSCLSSYYFMIRGTVI